MTGCWSRLHRDRRGTTAVEFAIISPVLILFLIGMLQYGQLIWTTQALQSVAQQTARCIAIGSSTCIVPATYAVTLAGEYGVSGLVGSGVQIVNTPGSTSNAAACSPPASMVFTQVTLTVAFTNVVKKLLPAMPSSIVAVSCYPISGS